MRIAGIVAEYNPFHKGHADLIARTRARDGADATHVVAVMSGAFVQRGEPASFPKIDRVKAALAGGVDLVLELPVPWVLTSAEGFAHGAVALLTALGCVDVLSFGSECGDVAALKKAASVMADTRYLRQVRYRMEQGVSAAEAQQKALAELGGARSAALLDTPNNLLGIEYLRACAQIDAPLEAFTVRRVGAGHDDEYPLNGTASASFLRRLLREGRWPGAVPFIPAESFEPLTAAFEAGHAPADAARLERAILLNLREKSASQLAEVAGVSEGLENRLYAAVSEAKTLQELLTRLKTRRYPLTRLQRLVWSAVLEIPAGLAKQTPPYLRVLGMTPRGQEILAAARERATLPFLSRATEADLFTGLAEQVWALECRAADWFGMALPDPLPRGTEYTDGVVRWE